MREVMSGVGFGLSGTVVNLGATGAIGSSSIPRACSNSSSVSWRGVTGSGSGKEVSSSIDDLAEDVADAEGVPSGEKTDSGLGEEGTGGTGATREGTRNWLSINFLLISSSMTNAMLSTMSRVVLAEAAPSADAAIAIDARDGLRLTRPSAKISSMALSQLSYVSVLPHDPFLGELALEMEVRMALYARCVIVTIESDREGAPNPQLANNPS